MKNLVIILLFNFLGFNSYSQGTRFDWVKTIGGTGRDHGLDIKTDSAGFIYLLGSFADSLDFEPGNSAGKIKSNGANDFFIAKFDSKQRFIWVKSFGGNGWDFARRFVLDDKSNIYLTGEFADTIDFDPGPGYQPHVANGKDDIFILKLSSQGDLLWANSFGGTDNESPSDIILDKAGDVITCGLFSLTLDFDPSGWVNALTAKGKADAYVLKFDSNGNFKWVRSFAGLEGVYARALTSDSSGNLYVTGGYSETADFDPKRTRFSQSSNGYVDMYIAKLKSNGDFVWAKSIGGAKFDHVRSIDSDDAGNIYLVGDYRDTVDFNPSPSHTEYRISNVGLGDMFVLKLNENGEYKWVKSFGQTSSEIPNSITVDQQANLYITGYFDDTVDFDPGPKKFDMVSIWGHGVFVQKLDSAGNFVWAKSVSGLQSCIGDRAFVDRHNNVFVTGNFYHKPNFDKGYSNTSPMSKGERDAFILKLRPCRKGDVNISTITSSLVLFLLLHLRNIMA